MGLVKLEQARSCQRNARYMAKLASWQSQRIALVANAFDEATLTTEQTYEHQPNTHDEATLSVKLDARDGATYEYLANACDDATVVAKLNARDVVAYEYPIITHGETILERVQL